MKEYIELGSAPIKENSTQIVADVKNQPTKELNVYAVSVEFKNQSEKLCHIYAKQLKRMFPDSSFSILEIEVGDWRTYREVVAYYNADDQQECDRVSMIENNLPLYWDEIAREELAKKD